ncbi:MAG TPA: hypothetical protein VHL09_13590 [Dehalococcoidia bacterium]|nr:hypothetical protein [Dehalococcoidia bacterium]
MAEILPFRTWAAQRPSHLPPCVNLTQVAMLLDAYLDQFDATGLHTPVLNARTLGDILIQAGQALIDHADRSAGPQP